MYRLLLCVATLLTAQLCDRIVVPVRAAEWSRFRGPNGSGVIESTNLPESLQAEDATWKIPVAKGLSSPIVFGNRLFLTSHEDDKRTIEAFDPATGMRLWSHSVAKVRDEVATPPGGHATPTPVAGGGRVFAFFPDFGLVACDLEGKELWQTPLGPFKSMHGMAASLVLSGNRLILLADQLQESFIGAYEPQSGRELWRQDRFNGFSAGYSTPVVHDTDDGQTQIIALGPGELISYDARNGSPVWNARETGGGPIGLPVIAGKRVIICNPIQTEPLPFSLMLSGDANKDGKVSVDEVRQQPGIARFIEKIDREFGDADGAVDQEEWNKAQMPTIGKGGLMSIELNGNGDVTETHVRWRFTKQVPQIHSILVYEDVLYMVQDGGVCTSFDSDSGEQLKRSRLQAGGKYYASPVAADGKLFLINTEGATSVLRAGRTWETLATGQIGEPVWATPAIAGDRLFIRGENHLFCFSNPLR
jgi:outer membrane protein assembly factor BamB